MVKYKILWIDDDINGPEMMSQYDALEDKGCIITPITNPDQLQFDTIVLYDCIILDMYMPTGDNLSFQETRVGSRTGFVLLKKIKKEFPNAKVVVFSVSDIPDVRKYCNDNSVEYWVKSHYLADKFANKIINYIELNRKRNRNK